MPERNSTQALAGAVITLVIGGLAMVISYAARSDMRQTENKNASGTRRAT